MQVIFKDTRSEEQQIEDAIKSHANTHQLLLKGKDGLDYEIDYEIDKEKSIVIFKTVAYEIVNNGFIYSFKRVIKWKEEELYSYEVVDGDLELTELSKEEV